MPEFDREKFYDVSRTMAAADKLLPADEQPERCQGLPLHAEIKQLIEVGVIECIPESDTTDAVLAVFRTRIEALMDETPRLQSRDRIGMLRVLELLQQQGQEHADPPYEPDCPPLPGNDRLAKHVAEQGQGLPLHEIARMICDEQRKACGDNECRCATARLAVDATVDATRTRIEALIEANQGMDPRTRVGMWEVLALLEGQE